MLRRINNITGLVLGLALVCGVVWLRVSFTAREMVFGYITRTTVTDSPKANDALLRYPIIGMFVGGALVLMIILASNRRNKKRRAMGMDTTDPAWIMLAVAILCVAGGAVYGHHFG